MSRILIISGELSSDTYGAELAETLLKKSPDLKIAALAGPKLQNIAKEFIQNIAEANVIGLWEQVPRQRFYNQAFKNLANFIDNHPVDIAIIIDFPHYHGRVAKVLCDFDIPIVTYITPHFWIWNDKKSAEAIAKYSHRVITVFEPEYAFYKSITEDARYFGHPLATKLPTVSPRKKINKPPIIGLFPGSRDQEIRYHLSPMLEAIKRLPTPPDTCYVRASAPRLLKSITKKVRHHKAPVQIWDADTEALYQKIDVAIVTAGTTSLELALRAIPQVVVGAISPITYFVARVLLNMAVPEFIAMPNILMKHPMVPEFPQKMPPKKIARAVEGVLEPEAFEKYQSDCKELQAQLTRYGDPRDAIADEVLGLL